MAKRLKLGNSKKVLTIGDGNLTYSLGLEMEGKVSEIIKGRRSSGKAIFVGVSILITKKVSNTKTAH